MLQWIRRLSLICVLVPIAGCVRYHARSIEPVQFEKEYRARNLQNPGLREFLARQKGTPSLQWPPPALDLDALCSIALYYNPELDVARARVQGADAAALEARVHTGPSLSLGAGHSSGPEAPFIFHLDPAVTLVTAGKRGYRLLEAQKLAEAARLELSESMWKIRARLRSLMVGQVFADRSADLLRKELLLRRQKLQIIEKRLSLGESSRPELESAIIELGSTEIALKSAEGSALTGLAALAEVLCVPAAALSNFRFVLPDPESAANADDLRLDRVQKAGLLNRIDVRRALLEYAAAEAALQLEVARQYPDIELMPGYDFDEGHHKFRLSPGFALPFPNRNRGPIAQASARRAEAEARFAGVQGKAIADIEVSLRTCHAVRAELMEAEKWIDHQRDQERMMLRANELGAQDRLSLTIVRLDGITAAKARLEILRKLQLAYGAVEDAVQQSLHPGVFLETLDPAFPARRPVKENQP